MINPGVLPVSIQHSPETHQNSSRPLSPTELPQLVADIDALFKAVCGQDALPQLKFFPIDAQYLLPAPDAQEEANAFTTKMTYLGDRFVKDTILSLAHSNDLHARGQLQSVAARIYKTDRCFDFRTHGFEFVDLRQSEFEREIREFAQHTKSLTVLTPQLKQLATEFTKNLTERLMSERGYVFNETAIGDVTYRYVRDDGANAVHLAHIDTNATFQAKVIHEFRGSIAELHKLKDPFIERVANVNIWIPLDDEVLAYPLALMDARSRGAKSTRNSFQTEFLSRMISVDSLVPQGSHRWYTKNKMKLGQVVIFDSCRTPHSAVHFPSNPTGSRRSFEARFLFMNATEFK